MVWGVRVAIKPSNGCVLNEVTFAVGGVCLLPYLHSTCHSRAGFLGSHLWRSLLLDLHVFHPEMA
jgi:hypothetical protein